MKKDELVDLRLLTAEIAKYLEGEEEFQDFEAEEVEPGPLPIKESTAYNKHSLIDGLRHMNERVPGSIEEKARSLKGDEKSSGGNENQMRSLGKDVLRPDFFEASLSEVQNPDFWDGGEVMDISSEEISSVLHKVEQIDVQSEKILRQLRTPVYDAFMHAEVEEGWYRLPLTYRGVTVPNTKSYDSIFGEEVEEEEIEEEIGELIEETIDGFETAEEFRSYVYELNDKAKITPFKKVPEEGTSLREKYVDVIGHGARRSYKNVLEADENRYVAISAEGWLEDYVLNEGGNIRDLLGSGYLGIYGGDLGRPYQAGGVVLDYDGVMEVIETDYAEAQEGDVSGAAD